MPARSHQIPGGARVLLYSCEVCSEPASFGYDVGSIRDAIDHKDAKRLGRWYCLKHKPVGEELTYRRHTASTSNTETANVSGNGLGELPGA